MDFKFNEEQEMLQRTVRDFLKKECPTTLVREIEEKKLDYDKGLYHKMAELGLLGLMIPEEYGGTGGSWIEMAIFYEEAGRALLQSPHFSTVVLGGQTILTLGSEDQKRELLPKIAKGELIMALALTEPEAGSNLELLTTTAKPEDKGYVIDGDKLFIGNAHIADHLIVVSTGEDKGVMPFLVERGSPGLTCIPLDTLSGERLNEVIFEKVKVPKKNVLGEAIKGDKILGILNKAKIMSCAEMVGGAEVALEMTVEYSKQRVAFERPIGSFQALQHRMADMAVAIEGLKRFVYYVAWMNSVELPSTKESAMEQLLASQVYPSITSKAIHIHGTVSLAQEHDLTLYYRKAKALQLNLGFFDSHKEVIAKELGI